MVGMGRLWQLANGYLHRQLLLPKAKARREKEVAKVVKVAKARVRASPAEAEAADDKPPT